MEVKTIEADIKPKRMIDAEKIGTYFNDFWQTIDTAVLILFVCVSIFLLSYVVEKYVRWDLQHFTYNVQFVLAIKTN